MPIKKIGASYLSGAFCLIVSFFFLSIGFLALVSNPTNLPGIFLFWGSLTIFILVIISLLPNSTFISLNNEGIQIHTFYKNKFIFYKDIELIDIYKARRSRSIGIRYNQKYLEHINASLTWQKKVNTMLSGMHEFLPTMFLDYNIDKLNYILNSYLLKYRHLQNPDKILDEAPDLSTL